MKPTPSTAEQARDLERQRIARDIHDDLGQSLLALKLELTVVRAGASGLVRQQIDGLIRHLDASILSLRAIIRDLRPGMLDGGLTAAVRHQLMELTRVSGIDHALQSDQNVDQHARQVDVTAMRIIQELLSNVARHAQASEVSVRLAVSTHGLDITVADNGTGASPGSMDGCYGLRGVRERAEETGGSLAVVQRPGVGTTVHVILGLGAR